MTGNSLSERLKAQEEILKVARQYQRGTIYGSECISTIKTALGITEDLEQVLERLIDKHGINGILDALTEVCNAKACHLEENWQDRASAKTWTRIGRYVNSLVTKLCKTYPAAVTGPF